MPSDFSYKSLRGRSFKNQDLRGANFSYADIKGANFSDANLSNANFSYAKAGLQKRWYLAFIVLILILCCVSGFFIFAANDLQTAIMDTEFRPELNLSIELILFFSLLIPLLLLLKYGWKWGLISLIILFLGNYLTISIYYLEVINQILSLQLGVSILLILAVIVLAIGMNIFLFIRSRISIFSLGLFLFVLWLILIISLFYGQDDYNLDWLEITIPIVTNLLAIITGIYIGVRTFYEDSQYLFLRKITALVTSFFGTNFQNANLTNADFYKAVLKNSNFEDAILSNTNFRDAIKLNYAHTQNTILDRGNVRDLLVTRKGAKKSYENTNLQEANLSEVDLNKANLKNANLNGAKLENANLQQANLTAVKAKNTNFYHANLTGACLANWEINDRTIFLKIKCGFVFLQEGYKQRHPCEGDFTKEELSLFFNLDNHHNSSIRNIHHNIDNLVLIDLSQGNLTQGFSQIRMQVFDSDNKLVSTTQGKLPPMSCLINIYNQWQKNYYLKNQLDRLLIKKTEKATACSLQQFSSSTRQLEKKINEWLNSEQFRPISDHLRETFTHSDNIRILIDSNDYNIHRLPLHLWRFFDSYKKAEIGFTYPISSSNIATTRRLKSKNEGKRILCILGDTQNIDLQADKKILKTLTNTQVVVLNEPSIEQLNKTLWNEKGWDIIFFAGHSQTSSQGNSGIMHLNQYESYSLKDFKYGFQRAIAKGTQLAIFNSCDGLGLARELIELQMPQVIVMREPIADVVAQEFLKNFLGRFTRGNSLYVSLRQAREMLQGWEKSYPCSTWLPVIFQNPTKIPPTWESLG